MPLDARVPQSPIDALAGFVTRHPRLAVLTGAGCSTASGLPGYRDEQGAWKTRPPVRFAEFVQHDHARRRYWSRSLLGWPRVARARPNAAHRALAALEGAGRIGRLDTVECLGCGRTATPQPRAKSRASASLTALPAAGS